MSRNMKVESPGEWEIHLADDTEEIAKYYQETLPQAISSVVIFLCSGILICISDWRIGGVFIALSLLQLLPVLVYETWARNIYNRIHTNEEAYNDWILEGLDGAADIRSYGVQEWYLKRFHDTNLETLIWGKKAEQTSTIETIISTAVDSLLNYGSYVILGAFVLFFGTDLVKLPFLIVLSGYLYSSVGSFISLRLQQAEYEEAVERLGFEDFHSPEPIKKDLKQVINIRNAQKSYDDRQILCGADLQIFEGEKVLLQGENGAGKSTILKMILGLEHADEGEVSVKIRKDGISYSLQEYPAFHLRASEVIDSLMKECQMDRTKLENCFHGFGIDSILDKPLCEMSQGERKKVFLALALAKKSELLVLDEPTNHLDADSVKFLCTQLAVWESTLIVCTHSQAIGITWNRELVVKGGKCYERTEAL